MAATQAPELISWLRAAGEPSRLRLLALCDQGDLSVSDLAQALGQSEPRVCRHLRILSEAGLIERFRNGQWVHYRLAAASPAASFVKGLLMQLDRGDAVFARDLNRARGGAGDRARAGAGAQAGVGSGAQAGVQGGSGVAALPRRTSESRLGRTLKDFIEAHAPADRLDSVLVVGVEHLELLETAASMAAECVAIAHSRRAAQSARAFAERRGFNCRVLLAATVDGLSERDLARAGQQFDAVILDHLATANTEFASLLAYARRALAPAGRMWLFERYESLEISRDKAKERVVEHPLARLRRVLGDAGLSCERLSPIEADDEHVLAAVAAPAMNREQVRRA